MNLSVFEYVGVVGGWIDVFGYFFCWGCIFVMVEEDEGQYDEVVEIFWVFGVVMFICVNLFYVFGGFDLEYFVYVEEIDFCWWFK